MGILLTLPNETDHKNINLSNRNESYLTDVFFKGMREWDWMSGLHLSSETGTEC